MKPIAVFLLLALSACGASENSKAQATPAPAETPAPESLPVEAVVPSNTATASIASVQLSQDCPDPKAEQANSVPMPTQKSKAKRSADSKSDSDGHFAQPCTQSTVQLAIAGHPDAAGKVSLQEVRLLDKGGTMLATLATRSPSIWREGGYEAWNQELPKQRDHKLSYKLGVPDWGQVEIKLGGSSFGQLYILEVDIDIDGTVTTLQSSEFERSQPLMIKT